MTNAARGDGLVEPLATMRELRVASDQYASPTPK
jgi:hypothetical protein